MVSIKRLCSMLLAISSFVFLLAVSGRPAYGFSGYVDPGTGLLALQAITSVCAAVMYFLRRRIFGLFGFRKTPKEAVVKQHLDESRPLNDA